MLRGLLIGASIGALIGLVADGVWAAIGLGLMFGFVGWLIGLIVSVANKPSTPATPAQPTAHMRIAALEARVAALEAQIRGQSRNISGAELPPAPIDTPLAQAPAQPAPVQPAPPPRAPAPPREPPKPNPIVAWFTGGNAIARIGIVVLFIGIAFLLRYAVEHSLVPPELRIVGIAAAGIVLLAFGWRLRKSRPGYALSLQGAGVGVLYLAVFGALRLYHLIPPEAAFPMLVSIAAFATFLAVRQDSAVLAGFGAAGGFVAPVLASTGRGDHVMLFTYFAVLNIAILTTAWFRSWRSLNLLGFIFTFAIGLLWGAQYYKPQHFATVEPFLVFFFLLYVAVAVLFARREATTAGRRVDGTLVFGVPIVGFTMQAALVKDFEYGLAFSALALGAFYIALAGILQSRGRAPWKLLVQSFLALGIGFLTLAIPLALDGRWTSAAWAIEGAAVLWVGARQKRRLPIAFGTLVQLAGAVSFAMVQGTIPREMAFVNGSFLGFLLIATAGLVSHQALRLNETDAKLSWLRPVYFVWGLFWWLAGVAIDLDAFLRDALSLNAFLAIAAATMLAFALLHEDGKWREAAWPSHAWLPAMIALFLLSMMVQQPHHPFANWGWLAWPFALGAHMWARKRVETAPANGYATFVHAGTLVLAALIGGIELRWLAIDSGLAHTAWSAAAWIVVPCALLLAVSSRALDSRWPIAAHPRAYRVQGGTVLAAMAFAWILAVNFARPGPSTPLPYLPLLNAIDLAHILVAITAVAWWRALERAPGRPAWLEGRNAAALAGVAAFVWANGILLRSLHHWADVPYHLDAWLRSFLVQASISIFWSALALGLMVYATRSARRVLWMIGAALMAVVVVKLALVDFARLGGLERIASFIGVGVLMLVVGYFSPVPPKLVPESK